MKRLTYLLILISMILVSCSRNDTPTPIETSPVYKNVKLNLALRVTDTGALKSADLSQYIPITFRNFDLFLIDSKGDTTFAAYDLQESDSLLLPEGTFKVQAESNQFDKVFSSSAVFFDKQLVPDSITINESTKSVPLEVVPACSLFYSGEHMNISYQRDDLGWGSSSDLGTTTYDPGDGSSVDLYYLFVRCENISYKQYILYVGQQYISLLGRYSNGRKFYADPNVIANLQATFTDSSL